ncbi:MAG: hypothetical protein COB49_09470 [Alphaproteobacteria bacterium]|nr:MAG: hypothetical protein COB49_09470 [Alphaproteobacteria bacterium]
MGLLKGFLMGFKGPEGMHYNILEAYQVGSAEHPYTVESSQKRHLYGLYRAYKNFSKVYKDIPPIEENPIFEKLPFHFNRELMPFIFLEPLEGKNALAQYLTYLKYGENKTSTLLTLQKTITRGVELAKQQLGKEYVSKAKEYKPLWLFFISEHSILILLQNPKILE